MVVAMAKLILKFALNPNFLNLTINKNFGSYRNFLVPFLNLFLLKSWRFVCNNIRVQMTF